MSRPATGTVVEKDGKRGRVYALRFRAYGQRHYLTTEATTRAEAEVELENTLADVRRGIWRAPTVDDSPMGERPEPTFHEFSSEWLESRRPELGERTYEDYRWSLTHHLLPFFKGHRLSEIAVREVDRYKSAKLAERTLAPNTVNKTLTRLSQILSLAAEYELISANPAAGKRRRVKGSKPRRPWAEPEQLLTLLEAATPLLGGRGRPLLAVLAGQGCGSTRRSRSSGRT